MTDDRLSDIGLRCCSFAHLASYVSALCPEGWLAELAITSCSKSGHSSVRRRAAMSVRATIGNNILSGHLPRRRPWPSELQRLERIDQLQVEFRKVLYVAGCDRHIVNLGDGGDITVTDRDRFAERATVGTQYAETVRGTLVE